MVSARALSKESPTLPTEGSMPASARRSVYLIETYRARVHRRLLPGRRRRPARVRPDRGDERAQRRVRDGREAAARALGDRVSRGAARRDAPRGAGGRGGGDAGGGGDPCGGPHDPRRGAEVRPRRRRHGPPGRCLAEERCAARRRRLADEVARHRARAPGGARRTCAGRRARRRGRRDDRARTATPRTRFDPSRRTP